MTIHAHAAPLESALFRPDLDVLRYLPWTVPTDSSAVPFSSDRWDLGALDVWPAYVRYTVINWTGIGNPLWRLTAKEVALWSVPDFSDAGLSCQLVDVPIS